ncbi:MAG: response regulator transcription factor, partial [Vallitaleaceae bacterium]|nr:response regulator transcription factor [Vallitaleaceae bacterium]
LARVRVALRHTKQSILPEVSQVEVFIKGELRIDFELHRVFLQEEEIHLTPIEFKLMELMARYPGRVLTHKFILGEIWGAFSGNDTQSLRVFMANIRRKIEKEPARPKYILTEVGVGYRLAED